MDIVNSGRSLLKLQYQLATWPLRQVERRVVGGLLGQDSAAHRAAERLIAWLDATAAGVLADESLRAEADRLRRHSDALAEATRLEREAGRHRAAAEQRLRRGSRQAEEQRKEAREEQQERVSDALKEKQEARKRVAERAAEHAADDKRQADERARQRADQAAAAQRDQEKRIEASTEQVVEPAKEELKDAALGKAEARKAKQDADELGHLAAAERAERRNSSKAGR